MNSAELIAAARRVWCEREYLREIDIDGEQVSVPALASCPPEVVAALLDVLTEALQHANPFDYRTGTGLRALDAIEEALK